MNCATPFVYARYTCVLELGRARMLYRWQNRLKVLPYQNIWFQIQRWVSKTHTKRREKPHSGVYSARMILILFLSSHSEGFIECYEVLLGDARLVWMVNQWDVQWDYISNSMNVSRVFVDDLSPRSVVTKVSTFFELLREQYIVYGYNKNKLTLKFSYLVTRIPYFSDLIEFVEFNNSSTFSPEKNGSKAHEMWSNIITINGWTQ